MKTIRNDPLGIFYGFGMVSHDLNPETGVWHKREDTYNTHFNSRCCEEIALTYADKTIQFANRTVRSPLQSEHSQTVVGETKFIMPVTEQLRNFIIDTPQLGVLIGTMPDPEYRQQIQESIEQGNLPGLSIGAVVRQYNKKKKKRE